MTLLASNGRKSKEGDQGMGEQGERGREELDERGKVRTIYKRARQTRQRASEGRQSNRRMGSNNFPLNFM